MILDERGRSSFAELQADLDRHGSERAVLYAFDLLLLDGEDLRKKPLRGAPVSARRHHRKTLGDLDERGVLRPWRGPLRIACENELEGIVSKRLDRAYHSGRSRDWLKTKCVLSDTFIIIGFQAELRRPSGHRSPTSRSRASTDTAYAMPARSAPGSANASLRRYASGSTAFGRALCGRRLTVGGAVWVSPDLQAEDRLPRRDSVGRASTREFQGSSSAKKVQDGVSSIGEPSEASCDSAASR